MAEMKIGNRLFHISTGMACPCCSQPEGSACTCHEMREENERLKAKLAEVEAIAEKLDCEKAQETAAVLQVKQRSRLRKEAKKEPRLFR